jgi:hypothetical protein
MWPGLCQRRISTLSPATYIQAEWLWGRSF